MIRAGGLISCGAIVLWLVSVVEAIDVSTEQELRDAIQEAIDTESMRFIDVMNDIPVTGGSLPTVNQSLTFTSHDGGLYTIFDGNLDMTEGRTMTFENEISFTGRIRLMDEGSRLVFGSDSIFGGAGRVQGRDVATLVYNSANNRTIDAAFAVTFVDFIAFEKRGSSTLTLSAPFEFAGPTSVIGGTLRAGAADVFAAGERITLSSGTTLALDGFDQTIGSIAGEGNVSLGNSPATTLTVGQDNTSSTMSGTISGEGTIVKVGTGTWTLSGDSTFDGPVELNAGGINLSGKLGSDITAANNTNMVIGGELGGGVTAGNNATVTISGTVGEAINAGDNAVLTISGDIGGGLTAGRNALTNISGTIAEALGVGDSSNLTISGSVSEGVTVGNNATGNITGRVGGGLDVGDSGTVSLSANNLSGSQANVAGDVNIGHNSTLTVTDNLLSNAAHNISGDVHLATGARLSGSGSIQGSVSADNDTFVTINGTVAGSLETGESSTVTLSTANLGSSMFNVGGNVTVGTGSTLTLTDSNQNNTSDNVGGHVFVPAGATIRGSGTIGGNLEALGTIALAGNNNPDNLVVRGNFVTDSTTELRLDAAPGGVSDTISVEGTATLGGGPVFIQAQPGTYFVATDYTILTADGGVAGTFAEAVDVNLQFLDALLSYDANSVVLTLARNSFQLHEAALTPNQQAVGQSLAQIAEDADGALGQYIAIIEGSPAPAARRLMEELSGDAATLGLTTVHAAATMSVATVSQRLSEVRLDSAVTGVPGTGLDQYLWIQGFAGTGAIDPRHGAPGTRYDVIGFNAGYDRPLSDQLRLGVTAGYSKTEADGRDRVAFTEIDSYMFGVYGGYTASSIYVDGALSVSYNKFDSARRITNPNFPGLAGASYDGWAFTAHSEVGYLHLANIRNGRQPLSIQPLVSITYTHAWQESYQERGLGNAGLRFDSTSHDSLVLATGLRIGAPIHAGLPLWLEGRGIVGYDILDDPVRMDARFIGGGPSFTVEGPDRNPWRGVIGAGVRGEISSSVDAFLNLDYTFSDDRGYMIAAGLRWAF